MTAAGWAIEEFGGVPYALLIGLFLGLFAARLVRGRACAVTPNNGPVAEN